MGHKKKTLDFEKMLRKHYYADGIIKYINQETNVIVLGRGSRLFKYGGGMLRKGFEGPNGIMMEQNSAYHVEHSDGKNKYHGIVVQMDDVSKFMVGDKLKLFVERVGFFDTFEMFLTNFHLYTYEYEHMDCLYGNVFAFVKCVKVYDGRLRFDLRRNYDYDNNEGLEISCVAQVAEITDDKVLLIRCSILNRDFVEGWIEATENHINLLEENDIAEIVSNNIKERDWISFSAKVYQYEYNGDKSIQYGLHEISINKKISIKDIDFAMAQKEVCWACAYDFECDRCEWCCRQNTFMKKVLIDSLCDYKNEQRKYARKKSSVSRNGFQKRVNIKGFVKIHDNFELDDIIKPIEVVFKDEDAFLHPLRLGPMKKLAQYITYEPTPIVDFDYNTIRIDGTNVVEKYLADNPNEKLTRDDVLEFKGTLCFHNFSFGVPFYVINNVDIIGKRTSIDLEHWRYKQLKYDAEEFTKEHNYDVLDKEYSFETVMYCLAYKYYNSYYDYDHYR